MDREFCPSYGKVLLTISLKVAQSCSHAGDCQADVEKAMSKQSYRSQLDRLDPKDVRQELRDYGAWSSMELMDHKANLMRLFWLACCDIAEEEHEK